MSLSNLEFKSEDFHGHGQLNADKAAVIATNRLKEMILHLKKVYLVGEPIWMEAGLNVPVHTRKGRLIEEDE